MAMCEDDFLCVIKVLNHFKDNDFVAEKSEWLIITITVITIGF